MKLADQIQFFSMAPISPKSENPVDFRAPPPSPIATGRRSSVTNEEVLTEFLEHSLRVPDLILPDKIFPKQKFIENPPEIDFQSLNSAEFDTISRVLDSIAAIGCFQLVNYGISQDFVRSAAVAGGGVFEVSPEKKAAVARSPERLYGFEEVQGEEGAELSEEFVWRRDDGFKLEMEGIWPNGYSNFSEKIETLLLDIEKIAEKIFLVLWENSLIKSRYETEIMQGQDNVGSICYLHKHSQNVPADRLMSSLRYDIIRMLIRGTDFSHALCFHICDGASEFHVYSKKGWVSFCPAKDALIITVGDQIKALSGGKYKHVIGRPIFKGEKEDFISMAFLCSSPSTTNCSKTKKGKTISLGQQAILALILTFLYYFFVYIYKKF